MRVGFNGGYFSVDKTTHRPSAPKFEGTWWIAPADNKRKQDELMKVVSDTVRSVPGLGVHSAGIYGIVDLKRVGSKNDGRPQIKLETGELTLKDLGEDPEKDKLIEEALKKPELNLEVIPPSTTGNGRGIG